MWILIFSILLFGVIGNAWALPKYGVSELISPNKEYILKLADTAEPFTYELKLLREGTELTHYIFNGELVSAYWSPSLKYVAVNNHYGHGGIWVWVISLVDGAIITSHGAEKGPNYDPYTDCQYFSNLVIKAHRKLKEIYPEVDSDQLRNGYSSVVYGWSFGDRLLMFHEFPFDDFWTKYNRIIQAFTTWKVTDQSVTLKSIRFRIAKNDQDEPMPPEVKKTLNFIP
jgi:hypothetical protein